MRSRRRSRQAVLAALRRRCLVVYPLALLLVTSPAAAQVNIEQVRRDADQVGISGSSTLDLTVRTGNVELVKFGLTGRADYGAARVMAFLLGRVDFGWQGGARFSNEALVHVRSAYVARPGVQPEAFVQMNYDKSRSLTFRSIFGGGIRVRLLQRDAVRLWLGTGYMFEHENLDLDPGAIHPDRTSHHRWSSYLSLRIEMNDRARFLWTGYAQPRFDELDDVRAVTDLALGVELSDPFSLVVSFRAHYDSRPPDDINSLDTTLKTGVSVEF